MSLRFSERSEMPSFAVFSFFRFERFLQDHLIMGLFSYSLLSVILLAAVFSLLLPATWAEVQHIHPNWMFYVEPDVADVGQQVRVIAVIRPPPPSSEVFRNITIEILHPNWSNTIYGPFESPNGSLCFYFTPTMNGVYQLTLRFPRQFFANNTIIYERCTAEATLTVPPVEQIPPPYASVGKWETLKPMQVARGGLGVAIVNGKIYAIGGSTQTSWTSPANPHVVDANEEYDPISDRWISRRPMPTARAFFGIAVYWDRIYCIGGFSREGATGAVEVYDPSTDSWENRAPLPTEAWIEAKSRGIHFETTAAVLGDKIHVVVSEGAHYAYDPATDTWTRKAPLPVDEYNFNNALVALGDRLYAISENHMYVYDSEKDSWREAAAPPMALGHAVAAVTSGYLAEKMICVFSSHHIVAVFGQWSAGYTHLYFPENNSWIRGADMPTGRVYPGVAAYNDVIYVIGGFKPVVAHLVKPLNDAERFMPPGYMAESTAPPRMGSRITSYRGRHGNHNNLNMAQKTQTKRLKTWLTRTSKP